MMHTIADLAITLGQSPELSLVVKMTIAAALGLAVVRFARAARAWCVTSCRRRRSPRCSHCPSPC